MLTKIIIIVLFLVVLQNMKNIINVYFFQLCCELIGFLWQTDQNEKQFFSSFFSQLFVKKWHTDIKDLDMKQINKIGNKFFDCFIWKLKKNEK